MEDKWKQKFNEKFSGFQREIPVPPFESLPQKRHRGAVVRFAAASAAAAAAVLALLFLARPSSPETPLLAYSIQEKEPQISIKAGHPEAIKVLQRKVNVTTSRIASAEIQEDSQETPETALQPEKLAEEESVEDMTSMAGQSQTQPKRILEEQPKQMEGRRRLSIGLVGDPLLANRFIESRGRRGSAGVELCDSIYTFLPPVSAGLSLRFDLSDRWAIESGLKYSCQQVNWAYRVDGIPASEGYYRQHFLGVPVLVNYHFLEHGRIRLYGSAGTEAAIRLSAEEKLITRDHVMLNLTRHEEGHPFLFSLSASAGLDYRLFSGLSIYIEPGVSMFLNETEDFPGYQWRNRAVFNFGAGVRYHFR